MFVGHGLLAFAVVAGVAAWRGRDREHALAVGVLAAAFATVPDVDVLDPLLSLLADPIPPGGLAAAFWRRSTLVHRTATHSLVVGAVLATAAGGWAGARAAGSATRRWTLAVTSLATVGVLVAVVWGASGARHAAVVAVAAALALAVATLAGRWALVPRTVGLLAAVGLLTHPFGDLLTGVPPPLLYPLAPTPIPARLVLHPDPTLHLLGAFAVELGTAWVALLVLAYLYGVRLRNRIARRSIVGAGYGGGVLVMAPPTLDAAVPFVATIIALAGLVAVGRPRRSVGRWETLATGLATLTVATLAYGTTYVLT